MAFIVLTSRKNLMYGCPMAWQSPMFARITSSNGFLTPCWTATIVETAMMTTAQTGQWNKFKKNEYYYKWRILDHACTGMCFRCGRQAVVQHAGHCRGNCACISIAHGCRDTLPEATAMKYINTHSRFTIPASPHDSIVCNKGPIFAGIEAIPN